MVKNIVGEDNAGENWAMLLEYGTQNREIIALQNMGLSRYSAQKIFKECRGAFISENGQLKKVDKHKVLSKLQKDSIEYIEAQKLLWLILMKNLSRSKFQEISIRQIFQLQ